MCVKTDMPTIWILQWLWFGGKVQRPVFRIKMKISNLS
nr:unnamed protein product [Callosobruchus chinensis]